MVNVEYCSSVGAGRALQKQHCFVSKVFGYYKSLVKIVTILSPLVGQTDSNIQNSKDFAEFITSQTLYHQMRLLSHLMWYHCSLMSRWTWPPKWLVTASNWMTLLGIALYFLQIRSALCSSSASMLRLSHTKECSTGRYKALLWGHQYQSLWQT